MKRKQLLVLVVAALILVVGGAIVSSLRTSGWQGSEDAESTKMLTDFPINDVTRIEIEGSDGTVTVAREEGRWRVQQRYGYPANYQTLKDFMVKITEANVAQTVRVGPSQYGRLELAEPGAEDAAAGTKVSFYGQDGDEIRTLVFGKEHHKKSDEREPNPMAMMGGGGGDWPDGRYILLPEQDKVVLVSDPFSSVREDPSTWMAKDFFKIGELKQAALMDGGEELWRVSRPSESADLTLEGPIPEDKEVDTSALSNIKSAFSWANFADIADPELSAEETGMDNPKLYVAREFGGVVYTVRIGKETPDGKVYLQAEADYQGPTEREADDEESEADKSRKDAEFAEELAEKQQQVEETNERLQGWTYIVNSHVVSAVLKGRDDLLKDKPEPEAGDDEGAEEAQAGAGLLPEAAAAEEDTAEDNSPDAE